MRLGALIEIAIVRKTNLDAFLDAFYLRSQLRALPTPRAVTEIVDLQSRVFLSSFWPPVLLLNRHSQNDTTTALHRRFCRAKKLQFEGCRQWNFGGRSGFRDSLYLR